MILAEVALETLIIYLERLKGRVYLNIPAGMIVRQSGRTISTEWYSKPTDTGLTLGFHACAPKKYKRNIVQGTVHRIDHSTSTWEAFDKGLRKAKND